MNVARNIILLLGLLTGHTIVSGILIFARGNFSGSGMGLWNELSWFLRTALPYGPGAALGGIGVAAFINSRRQWVWAVAFAILVVVSFVGSNVGINWRGLNWQEIVAFTTATLMLPALCLVAFRLSRRRFQSEEAQYL